MTEERKEETYTIENAVRDICSIETVQWASKDKVRNILERFCQAHKANIAELREAVAKYDEVYGGGGRLALKAFDTKARDLGLGDKE